MIKKFRDRQFFFIVKDFHCYDFFYKYIYARAVPMPVNVSLDSFINAMFLIIANCPHSPSRNVWRNKRREKY